MLKDKNLLAIKFLAEEADEVYRYLDKLKHEGEIAGNWMHDTERFMYFQYMEAKALHESSEKLEKHTVWLKRLTCGLGALAIAQIVLICIEIWR